MTPIGVILKIDALGRCVIPQSMRKALHIKNCETVEILLTKDGILIRNPQYEVVKKQSNE